MPLSEMFVYRDEITDFKN